MATNRGIEEPMAGQAERGTRKLKFTRYGLAEDPRGAHVVFEYKNRTLLGEVIGVSRDFNGSIHLEVRNFNGEPWPVAPLACLCRMLIRLHDPCPSTAASKQILSLLRAAK